MTALILRHWRRDGPLGLLLALSLVAIGCFLSETSLQEGETRIQGWRRIDTQAVLQRISAGDLQDREARWYHAASDGSVAVGGGR